MSDTEQSRDCRSTARWRASSRTRCSAPLGRDAGAFWQGFAALLAAFAPRNRALLAKRDDLQAQIDAWHSERRGQAARCRRLPRLPRARSATSSPSRAISPSAPQNVDPEIATMAGPQLVVPVLNARFLLNAANARWGSLYDALYGTDALDAPPAQAGRLRPGARRGGDRRRCARSSTRRCRWRAGSWADLGRAGRHRARRSGAVRRAAPTRGRCSSTTACISKWCSIREHPVGRDDRGRASPTSCSKRR